MGKPCMVYGQKGTGSVPVEATLLLLSQPYEVIERGRSEDRPAGNQCSRSRSSPCRLASW
jgi:hypothetical protein